MLHIQRFFHSFRNSCCIDSAAVSPPSSFSYPEHLRSSVLLTSSPPYRCPKTPITSNSNNGLGSATISNKRRPPPSSAPQLSSHLLSHRLKRSYPMRPHALTFHASASQDENMLNCREVYGENCTNCRKIFYRKDKNINERKRFCSGECRWSYVISQCDTQTILPQHSNQYHHHYHQTERVANFCTRPSSTTGNMLEETNLYIEEQKPIRYASEEESEHLSTLEADTEDDCSSICDSDDNNGEASQDDEDKYSNNDKA